MTAALDQQCGLAARFDHMEVGERRVAARERHEVTLGETRRLVEDARNLARPAILNLGHGILPATPVENVQAFVAEARTLWI